MHLIKILMANKFSKMPSPKVFMEPFFHIPYFVPTLIFVYRTFLTNKISCSEKKLRRFHQKIGKRLFWIYSIRARLYQEKIGKYLLKKIKYVVFCSGISVSSVIHKLTEISDSQILELSFFSINLLFVAV